MTSRNQKFGFHRRFTVSNSSPTHSGWFRDPSSASWSPESNDSDHSINSDEENLVAMETDCQVDTDNGTSHTIPFTAPLLTKSMSLPNDIANKQPKLYRQCLLQSGSSKSLVIGRPVKPIGLKDIDLSNHRRAEELRCAKKANRAGSRHIFSPVRQNSAPSSLDIIDRPEGCRKFRNSTKMLPHKSRNGSFGCLPAQGSKKDTNSNKMDKNSDLSIVLYGCKSIKSNSEPNPSKSEFPKLYSASIDHETMNLTQCRDEHSSREIEVIEIDDDFDALTNTRSKNNVDTKERKSTEKHQHCQDSPLFSDDDNNDDDDDDKTKVSGNVKFQKKLQIMRQSTKPLYIKLKYCSGALIMLIIPLIISSIYLYVNPHGLCLSSEFNYNLTGLENDLKMNFFGQHLASKVLLSSLRSHSRGRRAKPLVLSLHGWTGTGKNYASNLIAKHIFKNQIDSKFIYKFIIPLHFPHVSEVESYKEQLENQIISHVKKCNKGGLFIFDEMDKIPPGVVDILKPFLDQKRTASGLNFQHMIFLFLSNSGGMLINDYVLQHYKNGLPRESIKLVRLENLLHKYTESGHYVWYDDLLKSEVIDHFIPFLPMERTHIKQCILKDMRSKGYAVEVRKVTEVLDEMEYFPQDLQIFSVPGCKKVSSKVDVAMG